MLIPDLQVTYRIIYGDGSREDYMAENDNCESCSNFIYDEEYGYYICEADLDEDEMEHFIKKSFGNCPHYQYNDEYKIVRKQI